MCSNESHIAVQTQHGENPTSAGADITVSPVKPGKLLRLPAVMDRCGLGRSSIYAGVKAGTFPAPVRLSARAVGFFENSIDRWISERTATTTTGLPGETVGQAPEH